VQSSESQETVPEMAKEVEWSCQEAHVEDTDVAQGNLLEVEESGGDREGWNAGRTRGKGRKTETQPETAQW
jgi:hypothetical protein